MLGVSPDDRHDRKDLVEAMRGRSFPAALLAEVKVNTLGMPTVLPSSCVIDAAGVIRARLPPSREALTAQKLEAIVVPLLAPVESP